MSDARLAQFRADATPAKPTKASRAAWVAPTIADLANGSVMAFDQSLSALGWIFLNHEGDTLEVLAKGSVRTEPADFPTSHQGTLERGLAVYDALGEQWEAFEPRFPGWPWAHFVHEYPPVGGRMARPESSLVSAMVVRIFISRDIGMPMTMVSNQHSKSVLVNNGNATKREWHRGLEGFPLTGALPTNEGERDALCLGLTHLLDLRRAS